MTQMNDIKKTPLGSAIHGFTIVELLVVIVVITILATISVVTYRGVQEAARDKSVLSDIDNVASELAGYASRNGGVYGSAIVWFSGSGANPNISFTPSSGTVIDVVAYQSEYCIRAYNPASNYKVISTALTKGSTDVACDLLFASTAAGGTGGSIVGWWKFNGTTKDDSNNARDGTAVNVIPTTDKLGNANSAYDFNGTSSYVSLGTDGDYDYANFSVSIWAKAIGVPGHVRDLIGKGNWNSSNDWYIGFKSGTSASFVYGLANWSVGPSYSLASYDQTKWTHYVGTVTPTQEKLYIDGSLVSTVTAAHSAVTSTYDLQIGRSSYLSNYFSGSIDDVRLYNQVLPASAVTNIFNNGPR